MKKKNPLLDVINMVLAGGGTIDLGDGVKASAVGSPEMPKALADGIACMGKMGTHLQTSAESDAERLVAQLLVEASIPGNTKAGATKLLEAATPEVRKAAAGAISGLAQMANQMLALVGIVGSTKGDDYVQIIGGCGDPECENCGGIGTDGVTFDMSDEGESAFTGDSGPIFEIAKALQKSGKNKLVS